MTKKAKAKAAPEKNEKIDISDLEKKETLSAEGIGKSFGNRQIVKHVNLKVQRGEIVGLLGPNGAGKTTVFYMIIGLIRPDHGNIFWTTLN